jgi:acyl carrier protein
MAVDTPVAAHLQEAKAINLRHGVRTSEAQTAFDRVLANPLPQVVVSPQDLPRLADYYVDLLRAGTGATAAPSDDVALPDQPAPALHARPRVASAYAAPTTELESQIVGIWHTLLGIAEIGVDDSFFDLGGHSLLATQLLARIQQLCGLQLPLRTVFEHQTVAALAAHITSLRAATSVEVVEGEREEIEI